MRVFLFALAVSCIFICAAKAADPRLVFAHYMLYANDNINVLKQEIQLAQSRGIDAFALNSNVWRQNLADNMYQAAKEVGPNFKIFFSADIHKDANGNLTPEQLAGGRNKFFYVPFFPTDGSLGGVQATLDKFKDIIDGLFAWDTSAWPYFSPDFQNPSVSKDQNYLNACKAAGKVYMASPSSWFFKNIAGSCCSDACKAKDLSNCNCQVKGNYQGPGLWIKKWEQLIQLSPPLLEIVTWNDWVETSYVAPPLSTAAADVSGYTHRAFLELGQYYFNWYKSGSQPAITQDSIYLFYYTQSKNINVPADGCKVVYSDQLSDKVYVTAKLTGPATVELRSGSATHTFSAPKGISTWSMDFQAGQQLATLKRGGKVLSTLTGSKLISNSNATHYNFNVYSTCTTC
ncbi:hypothetical protein SUGI_0695890 [Cryptomeria japonica]|nr:hypothetical protein SUGI_0695890 [Cryptomeria japonica]